MFAELLEAFDSEPGGPRLAPVLLPQYRFASCKHKVDVPGGYATSLQQ